MLDYQEIKKELALLLREPEPTDFESSFTSIGEAIVKTVTQERPTHIPIGSWSRLNSSLGGGLREREFTILCGPTGCLSGDTMISINRGGAGAKISIRDLYLRKNGIAKNRNFSKKTVICVRSWDGTRVTLQPMVDVFISGVKETWNFRFGQKKQIRATPCHRFLTRRGWVAGRDLVIGDRVAMDVDLPRKTKTQKNKIYDCYYGRAHHHPYATKANKERRIVTHRAAYEAKMNNLSLSEFREIIATDPIRAAELKYVNPKTHHVHHVDHDHSNNNPDNLELLSVEDHMRHHGNVENFGCGLRWVPFIAHDKPGVEAVYDIECPAPHHNFVANGLVVHNSGKSTLLANVAAQLISTMTPIFIASVEIGVEDFTRKIISVVTQRELRYGEDLNEMLAKVGKPFLSKNTVFTNYDSRVPHMQLLCDLLYAYRTKGVKVALVDNLNFIMEVTKAQDQVISMDRAVHDFVVFCKKVPIHVIMVMHPRKTDGGRIESEFDIKGSSTAVQEASNVILFNRLGDIANSPHGVSPSLCRELKFAKVRRNGRVVGTRIILQLIGDSEAYREARTV